MAARSRAGGDPARALLDEARRALAAGKPHQASAAARRLVKLKPRDRDALNMGAWITHQAGDARGAARLLEQSLALDPDQVEALSNLASLYQAEGRSEDALALLDRALARADAVASLHYNRGNALKALGRLAAAEQAFRAAIARQPDVPAFHGNLANTLVGLERLEDAVEAYRASLALRADHAETQRHLATTLRALRRFDEAGDALRIARALDPRNAETERTLGLLLADRGDFAGAAEAQQRAIALDPSDADAHNELGLLRQRASRLSDAAACFEAAIAAAPDKPGGYLNLGGVLSQQGRHAEALAALERAVALAPDDANAGSGLVFALHYQPEVAPQEIARRHVAWAERHMDALGAGASHANVPDPSRRLRVGYVSPDFRWHAVSDFLLPLLAHHDRTQVEIACYAEVVRRDARTDEFEALADRWRVTAGLGNERVAAQIRDDGIDILVDLAGHTLGNRLAVFARKPAPLQLTWLGYPGTTGMAAIDYRLTDAVADPSPAADALHRERLLRLPHGFLTYRPRHPPPDVAPAPSSTGGGVTFGSFNNLAKLNERVIACWARILAAVPDSRLLLKSHQLADAPTRALFHDRLVAAGIASARARLEPSIADWTAHMAVYGEVDVALDPFPYNGTTTTCEALWMGVPVVALAGDRHAGRVGASLLTEIGLDDLIAADEHAYAAIAVALARDQTRLAALRAELRSRCVATLGDGARFARDVESAYRAIWTAWCARRADAADQS
ncbi:MAG TPA: tetratricopeptide repeat protein [Candidatus Sulfotelmatobacter sp.]|nr:tetratricopeptide repeat protein [Candidatus Sulfotelmatobacter sp.]